MLVVVSIDLTPSKAGFFSGQHTLGSEPVKPQTDFLRYSITTSDIGFLSNGSTLLHYVNSTHFPCLLCGVVQMLSSSSPTSLENDIWEVATLITNRNTTSLSILLLHRMPVNVAAGLVKNWILPGVLTRQLAGCLLLCRWLRHSVYAGLAGRVEDWKDQKSQMLLVRYV